MKYLQKLKKLKKTKPKKCNRCKIKLAVCYLNTEHLCKSCYTRIKEGNGDLINKYKDMELECEI